MVVSICLRFTPIKKNHVPLYLIFWQVPQTVLPRYFQNENQFIHSQSNYIKQEKDG